MARPRTPAEERFWPRVNKDDPTGCWLWQGALDKHGYGAFNTGVRVVRAHRFAFEVTTGQTAVELDHLCRVPRCVRPDHLEPVTHRENMLRAPSSLVAIALAKTHCANGHPLSGSNVRIRRGKRECQTCVARDRAAYNEKRRQRRAMERAQRR